MPSIIGDLEIGISAFLVGINAVVFTAGSGAKTGPDKTIDVDQNGAIRLIEDCVQNGVKRFIMISAIGADPLSKSTRIQHYIKAKGVADVFLRNSNLDYTIIAPGTLTNEPGLGRVKTAEKLNSHGFLPREDLADFIIQTLRNFNSVRKTFEVISGEQKIKDSISTIVGDALPPIA